MLYNDLELPAGIRQAIKKLADAGMVVTTETLIQDCKKSDGTRFRTFTLQGRHDLALIVRKVADLKPIDPGPKKAKVKLFEPPEPPAEIDQGVNFWLDRAKWHRLSSVEFCPLVQEECLDDLRSAPDEVQADVRQKFDRLCKSEDWPL